MNFVVEGSIEERVLERLLTKIEIFRESIGEPDPIIGEQIERLAGRALQGDLAPEELDRLVEQEGDALARRVLEAKQMLTRVDGLLAADQALIDEIDAILGKRQLPSERELILFLNSFLANRYPGTQLPARVVEDVVSVSLGTGLGFALEAAASELGHDAAMFGRRISTGPVDITLSREAGYRHPRAELVHLQHPITRFAVSEITRERALRNAAFAMSLSTNRLPPGTYGFLVSLIHVRTQRSLTKLVALFSEWEGGKVWADPDEGTALLIEMLERGQDFINAPHLSGSNAVSRCRGNRRRFVLLWSPQAVARRIQLRGSRGSRRVVFDLRRSKCSLEIPWWQYGRGSTRHEHGSVRAGAKIDHVTPR